jgi:hypothetical protein
MQYVVGIYTTGSKKETTDQVLKWKKIIEEQETLNIEKRPNE